MYLDRDTSIDHFSGKNLVNDQLNMMNNTLQTTSTMLLNQATSDSIRGAKYTVVFGKQGNVTVYSNTDESVIAKLNDILSISVGNSHYAAVTADGDVIVYGKFFDSNGELLKEFAQKLQLSFKAVKVASGDNHVLVLSDSGYVYSMGNSEFGQLGRLGRYFCDKGGRRGVETILTPKRITALRGNARDVFCTRNTSFAVTDKHTFVWGINNCLSREAIRIFMPQNVCELNNVNVVDVVGDNDRVVVRDSCGRVYYARDKPQHPKTDRPAKITRVPALPRVVKVFCHHAINLALTSGGILYAWGLGATSLKAHSMPWLPTIMGSVHNLTECVL